MHRSNLLTARAVTSGDRKLRAIRPRAQVSGALSCVSAKATRRRSRRPGRLLPAPLRGRPCLSAAHAGHPAGPQLRTSSCWKGGWRGIPSGRCPPPPGRSRPLPPAPPPGGTPSQHLPGPGPPLAHLAGIPALAASHPRRASLSLYPAPPARADPQHKGPGGALGGGGVDARAAPPAPRGLAALPGRGSTHSPPGRSTVHPPSCSGRRGRAG